MFIKQLIDEDFVNYKKPSMFVGFSKCSFKCDIECGMKVCQNSILSLSPSIPINTDVIINRYINNPLTSALVCGGLEPFDSFDELYELICKFRLRTTDDIVIYTGYYENEIYTYLKLLCNISNITIKFGRFIPGQVKHYDPILGVNLASPNQYAKIIS